MPPYFPKIVFSPADAFRRAFANGSMSPSFLLTRKNNHPKEVHRLPDMPAHLARRAIEKRGYATLALDVSEFRKLDGGLSCLSLRF